MQKDSRVKNYLDIDSSQCHVPQNTNWIEVLGCKKHSSALEFKAKEK